MQESFDEDHKEDHKEDRKEDELEDNFNLTSTNIVTKDTTAKIGFEFPFDLNNLFSMQYSFDTLKQAIEFLAKQQGEHAGLIQKHDQQLVDNNTQLYEQNIKLGEHTTDIADLKLRPTAQPAVEHTERIVEKNVSRPIEVTLQMYTDLREKMEKDEATIKENHELHLAVKRNADHLEERMTQAQSDIEFLKTLGAPSGGDGDNQGLINIMNDRITKLRAELVEIFNAKDLHMTSKVDDMKDDLNKRIAALIKTDEDQQAQLKEQDKLQTSLLEEMDANRSAINVLKENKVDQDEFDKEIFEIKDMISKMNAGEKVEIRAPTPKKEGPKITQANIDRWNEAATRVDKNTKQVDVVTKDIEEFNLIKDRLHHLEQKSVDWIVKDQFNVVVNDIKNLTVMINVNTENVTFLTEDSNKLKSRVDAIIALDCPNRGEFDLLKTRVDQLENFVANIRKQMEGILNKMKGMSGGSVDPGALQDCLDELKRLRNEFDTHRDETNRNLNDLNITMPTKASIDDLNDLENRLMAQIREMIGHVLSRIPDKDEMMKKFAVINKKIRDIMESLALLQGGGAHDDDGMFTKKPYGPGACASCDKNLINIQGQPADFYAWKKLPFRDPGERIAKYGQGFSKILNNMKGGHDGLLVDTNASYDQFYNNSRSTAPETDHPQGGPHGYSTHARTGMMGAASAAGTTRVVSTTRNTKPKSQFASPHKFGHAQNASVDDSMMAHGQHPMDQTIPSQNTFQHQGPKFGVNVDENPMQSMHQSTDTLPKLKGGGKGGRRN